MHNDTNIKLRDACIATPVTRGKRRIVLKNIDLAVSEGELIYIIGRVGSGKSSLLKTLYGELPIAGGKGLVAGFRLDGLARSDIPMLRRKLGMVFQDFQLLHDRTVYQNLSFVLKATGWRDPEHIRHRIEETLDTIGLRHKMNSMPHQLSGGEQQRVAVGRAFLNRPAVILADEPTGNLDPDSAAEVMELFLKLAGRGCSVLLATHNISLIEQYPARIIRIKERSLEEVDHAAVFGTPQPTYAQPFSSQYAPIQPLAPSINPQSVPVSYPQFVQTAPATTYGPTLHDNAAPSEEPVNRRFIAAPRDSYVTPTMETEQESEYAPRPSFPV